MPHDGFIREVQKNTGLVHWSDALRAIRITLEMLGETLAHAESKALANDLPPRIAIFLSDGGAKPQWHSSYLLTWAYLTEREGIPLVPASKQAVGVLQAICDAYPDYGGVKTIDAMRRELKRVADDSPS